MLSTPMSRTPVSFGQTLGNGVAQMDASQQLAQQNQTRALQTQMLQQHIAQVTAQQQAAQAQKAARDAYIKSLPAEQQTIANADPTAAISAGAQDTFKSPWQFDAKNGVLVNAKTGQFKPITQMPGMPGFTAPTTSGLPAETHAYVQKIQAALNGQPAFDAQGNPTPAALAAVKQVESGGNPNAVSPAGAQGAFQLMPGTAASVGVTNPFDPTQAQAGASQYLSQLYKRFGNPTQAFAAYNAGPGRVASVTPTPAGPMTLASYEAANHPAASARLPAGYQWNADHTAALPIPGIPQKTDFQGSGNTPLPGDPTLSGTDYIASIQDPGTQTLAKSYLAGDNPPPCA